MFASVGNFSLWLSLCFAIFQFFTSRQNNKLKFITIAMSIVKNPFHEHEINDVLYTLVPIKSSSDSDGPNF